MANRHLLFYYNPEAEHPAFGWAWIDKWCALYDVQAVIVDPQGVHLSKETPPYYFRSLAEALAHPDLAALQWVWLDANAPAYWDTVSLPQDDMVYCLGDDRHGFFTHVPDVEHSIRMRPPALEYDGEWFAAMVVPLLLFEVYGK